MTGVLQRALDQQPPSGFNPERLPAVDGVGTPTGRPGEFVELGSRPPLPADVYEDSYYRSSTRILHQLRRGPAGWLSIRS